MQDSDIEDHLETHGHYSAKMAFTYHISKHSTSSYGSLVGRGANGHLARADVHILERIGRKVSVTGIDRILGFYTFIPFLQYFQSVYQDGLCTGNRGFGSETLKQIKMATTQGTEGLILTDVGSAESKCFIF